MNSAFSLHSKKILVTGASSGIGRQIAFTAAEMGGSLIVTGRNEERLKTTFNGLEGNSHQMAVADLNVASEVDGLIDQLPVLDGVVLCAGVIRTMLFKFINEDELTKIMATNFISPLLLLNKLIKAGKLNRKASIVFISSISGNFIGIKGSAMYSASKGAINAIQKVLALELAPKQIRVNNISPGMVRTEMLENETAFSPDQISEDEKKYPLGYGEPVDVANAAVYLLSDASKWMTGASMVLDGGFTIQ